MIRRFAFAAAGAVLAASSLASCATFSDQDAAARVGSVELSRNDIDQLMGLGTPTATDETGSLAPVETDGTTPETLDATAVREALTQWIRVVLVESNVEGMTAEQVGSTDNLTARMENALDALAKSDPETGRSTYEQGVPNTPTICLGAIPVGDAATAAQVLADLDGGLSFADAATQYSTDPGLAGNGGVVTDENGNECFSADNLNPSILEALNGLPPGTPASIVLDTLIAVIQLRPFDDLSDASKLELAQFGVAALTLPKLVAGADVYVDPYYGYWDSATASVLPLGG